MSDSIDDGGPAFPVSDEASRGRVASIHGGMTLRDYFAAKAMHAFLVTKDPEEVINDWSRYRKSVASDAYDMADSMLVARDER